MVCREFLGWDVAQALSLVTGAAQASSEPGRELAALARRLAADPAALQAMTGPGGDRRARLRASAPRAAQALDDYLDRYGHRTVNLDPGEPTWFERPEVVAGLLEQQVRYAGADSGEVGVQADALAHARAQLAGRTEEDQARFERALAYARRAYGVREDNIVWLDNQPSALLRYCAVEIGRRLADRGVLAHAANAVFLEEPELRAALSSADTEDLRGLVARRKAERAWVSAHPGPPCYGKDPGPPPDLSALPPALRLVNAAVIQTVQLMLGPSAPQDAPNELRGVPGSPGRYSGTARVVRDETEFAKLGPGDVLVAPVTSPPWSVLFLQAGAVVTDGGGVLSHTAVIAREYGIPAVLATGQATRRLSDGDLVSVDGTAGIVSITPGSSDPADPGPATPQPTREAAMQERGADGLKGLTPKQQNYVRRGHRMAQRYPKGARLFSNANRALIRLTGRRLGGTMQGLQVGLLTTTGRRSGRTRTVPVICLDDGSRFLVAASNSGLDTPPAWCLNLRAQPNAEIHTRTGSERVVARELTDSEREEAWGRLLEYNPALGGYQSCTERQIALFALERRPQAKAG